MVSVLFAARASEGYRKSQDSNDKEGRALREYYEHLLREPGGRSYLFLFRREAESGKWKIP